MSSNFSKAIALLFFSSFFFYNCTTKPPQIVYSNYSITKNILQDSNSIKLLMPYKQQLSNSLKEVIGFSTYGLYTKKTESSLGNFMADAMKNMAEQKFKTKITAAFINSGGIRSNLPKGEITTEDIFNIMPFDNIIILQEVKGSVLKDFLNHACEKGGWPVSKGLKYTMNERKLVNAEVEGKEIIADSTYIIANSDYVINGGDNTTMLKKIPKQNINYLLRDALIDYIKALTKDGKTIDAKIENRITDAKQ
jgi:2',3'-cyclic-nucleotide 2'-phosphodiesterase (5'-nucleotidase family)